jgi:peptidoglycan/xylan/chitin deacetylase (PgdA/CDA1 family)
MYFCIRDDDTSFFTSPEQLEKAYGEITQWGPVSLAVVPFHRAGTSKGVPEKFRGRWTVHPLHENRELVEYLRSGVSKGRFEIMLHGYHHDEPGKSFEFVKGTELVQRVADGRKYLEDLLDTKIRVFVAPRNAVGRAGLRAIARAGLHLGGTAGVTSGWSVISSTTWKTWLKLRKWRQEGGLGVPWILDLGDHREIGGNPVTPLSSYEKNAALFRAVLNINGVFCAATHYWELEAPSVRAGEPSVGEHLHRLVELARSESKVIWRNVGESLENGSIAG